MLHTQTPEAHRLFDEETVPRNPPQSRIGRLVNLEVKYLPEQWNYFLNNLGVVNQGRGNALALGSLHMTYVSAKEIGKMLSTKYEHAYQSPKKALNLHRQLGKSFLQFYKQQVQSDVIATPYGDIVLPAGEGAAAGTDVDLHRWSYADMACHGLADVGKDRSRLAIIGDDPLFEQEMSACRTFLKQEGLNTKYIDHARPPHVTLFIANGPISEQGIRLPDDRPAMLPMSPPIMLTT